MYGASLLQMWTELGLVAGAERGSVRQISMATMTTLLSKLASNAEGEEIRPPPKLVGSTTAPRRTFPTSP